ncbi:MAG: hypothetical protein DBX47_07630 [Clostridiales bacterium]|nr:MAG: hypothetical protein DBX47_07630 [Clostridiales bacterium]
MDNEKKLKQLKTTRRLLLITLLLFVAVFILMNTEYISLDNTGRMIYDVRSALKGKNVSATFSDISESPGKEAAVFKDGFVTASESIITVYSSGMYKYSENSVSMKNPVLRTTSKKVLAFDRGGKQAYVLDSFGILYSFQCAENIINAGISENGNIFIITESYGYKGRLTVYDNSYSEIFNWDCKDEYVVDAIIGKGFVWAVSFSQNVTTTDTVLRKINYSEATIQQKIVVEDAVYASIAAKKNGELSLITDNAVTSVKDSEQKQIYSFVSGSLSYFAQSDEYTLLTANNKTVLLDIAGNTLFTKEYKDIKGLYINGNSFYIFHENLLTVLSSTGEVENEYPVSDATIEILVSDGICYTIGADFAEKIFLK